LRLKQPKPCVDGGGHLSQVLDDIMVWQVVHVSDDRLLVSNEFRNEGRVQLVVLHELLIVRI
jgi:hypothetical protein